MDDLSVAIPERLLARLRAGRAALVVGASFGAAAGLPGWGVILGKLAEELGAVDSAAAEDARALIDDGRHAAAAAILWRGLGAAACEAVLASSWRGPESLPAAALALARVPVRAVWTTFPGDLVERALAAGAPREWPEARVVTIDAADRPDLRRRHVLRLLGDLGGYAITSAAARRLLPPSAKVRGLVGELYHDGALLLVGFDPEDPDLHVLLERLLGALEPPGPEAEHLLVTAARVDRVRAAELEADHGIAVVAADPVTFLAALAAACEAGGVTLARARPDEDDLEGWAARLTDDPGDAEARAALAAMEGRARAARRPERLIEVLLARVEHETASAARGAALRELARAFEETGDLPRAFTALATAVKEEPTDEALVAEAERLAAETDGWAELVADLAEVVPQIQDKRIAAGYWVRLGRWYHEKLAHDDYAVASFRAALKLDGARVDARTGLAALTRRQQRWGELAEELAALAGLEADPRARVTLLAELAELQETALASPARATETWERIAALDPAHEGALAALERLHRRAEAWGKLAAVLERRAAAVEASDPNQAAAWRRELAALRAEKLGDVEGAIARFEAALATDPGDLEALRSLVALYERAGRTGDALDTLERLAAVAPDGATLWRRLAAEVEDREGGATRAIRAYEKVLELEPGASDAHRSLERLYRAEHAWESVVALHERQIARAASPSARAELWMALGRLFEQELLDPHRAVEAHANAAELAVEPATQKENLIALARLYRRIEGWDRAVAALEKHAELAAGAEAADLWHESALLHAHRLGDESAAEARLARALEVNPAHVPSLVALVELARRRGEHARAVAWMLDAERASGSRLERVGLLHEAALLCEEKLGQEAQAVELWQRVLQLDPEHVEAGRRLAERTVAARDWVQAEPILEMLARVATDRLEIARRNTQLGDAAEALGRLEKAARCYGLALAADPDSLPAALGQAKVHVLRHEWRAADAALRALLSAHRPALAQGQVVEIWHQIGTCARRLGDVAAAEEAFRHALDLDPGHRASLDGIVELAGERGDWKAVVRAKRDALEGATEDERLRLYEEIGDLTAGELGDPTAALGVYLEALKLRPRAHLLLHKVLEIYTGEKQWRRAVEVLDRLAEIERDPAVRAKVSYTAALIARDELHDADEAVARMTRALDDAPALPGAFETVEEILSERGDWKGLARATTSMIKRLGERATPAQLLYLWTRLGDVALEKLDDAPAAMAAYEVASALEPQNIGRHEQLAELYLAGGPGHVDKAIAELQLLLKRFPDRLELYHQLFGLYRDGRQRDKAYCMAQALIFLGHATAEEKALAAELRPKKAPQARRRLTEELWQKSIQHAREDRTLNQIFGLLAGALAATTAQPHHAAGLNPREQVDADDPRPLPRLFRHAVQVLGISPAPELYLRPGRLEGMQAANVAEKGVLTPALVVGDPHASRRTDERESTFDLGKKLAWFRPERYAYYALGTVAKLETALAAALVASGASPAGEKRGAEPDVEKLVVFLGRTVPHAVLDDVAALARRQGLGASDAAALGHAVSGWVTATDLTANRVGLILADDLEQAARAVATEKGIATTMSAKDRLRDLLAFAASEEYFAVRRHLGVEVGA